MVLAALFADNCDRYRTHAAMTANLLGLTLIGERAWDISRAVDLLETMPKTINAKKILLTGNSGGGTATDYAACIEPRITMVLPSSSVCPYKHSIVWKHHCPCNYIPNIAKYLDMGDLACLIAPRPLVIVAGVYEMDSISMAAARSQGLSRRSMSVPVRRTNSALSKARRVTGTTQA